jgi:hypothetical protein
MTYYFWLGRDAEVLDTLVSRANFHPPIDGMTTTKEYTDDEERARAD